MSYVKDNLMKDENIIYNAYLHWIVFIQPLIWLIITIIAFNNKYFRLWGFSVYVTIATFIGALMDFTTTEFALTNKRVIAKFGFIKRQSLEILLTKVESITVDQGILGRMCKYGTIGVRGTGGSLNLIPKISKPFEFRMKANELIELSNKNNEGNK